jgi:hypothetical protein
VCDGVSTTCPADAFEPSGTLCTDDGELCTLDECDGAGICAHPAGNAGTVCRAASVGEVCDVSETCDGVSTTCPADGVEPSGTVCRSVNGVCDLQEQCDGLSKTCPVDAKDNTTVCRPAADVCDVGESCDGVGNDCPADGFESSATVCRPAGGECDTAESCTGTGPACPADAFAASGTPCTDDGETCTADQCDGGGACTHPAGNGGTVCRSGAGECDVEETCDGLSTTCPTDTFEPSGAPCTDDGEVCTADQCDGAGTCAHPAGNSGTVCRTDAGECDVEETCDGVSTTCPADAFEPSGTTCADDGEVCTADQCDGAGTCAHPAGNAGTQCRAVAGSCDLAETCDGASTTCPADTVAGAGTECRADAGDCDVAEQCNGIAASCPPDAFESAGASCNDGNACTQNTMCDGAGDCGGGDPVVCVDDFKCYKAKDLKQPKFQAVTVALNDQFGLIHDDDDFELKKPFLMCNPTNLNGGGISNPIDHLTCYKIKGSDGKIDKAQRPRVEAHNQLGTIQLELKKAFVVCVPSAKLILP